MECAPPAAYLTVHLALIGALILGLTLGYWMGGRA